MPNLMTNIFIGYVEEIIYKDDRPTLELRVRIPSIHGTNSRDGLKKQDLPIAKPIFMPGASYKTAALEQALQNINKVFVIFESGDQQKPVYFGVKGNEDLYEIPSDQTISGGDDSSGPSITRENRTFAQDTDPSQTTTVINGDLWFDTSESSNGETGTLETTDDGQGDEDEGLNQESTI